MVAALEGQLSARSPLSVAAYMDLCNQHYYGTRDPFGPSGDFTTAPEISQIFGELIGAFISHIAEGQNFTLIEGGPGRGTLMADILRAMKDKPDIKLVETSASLRLLQEKALAGHDVEWVNDISSIKSKNQNNILIFNELFDVLPIEQYVGTAEGWHERQVVFAGGRAAFAVGAKADVEAPYICTRGAVLELSAARTAFMEQVCDRMRAGGMAIIIDYGPMRWAVGDTLQALGKHQFVDPLVTPGEVDLTSHVDFDALAGVARTAGLYVHPVMTQGAFLNRLGGALRAERLRRQADYARLAEPEQMGDLFKVLIVGHPDWASRIQAVFP